MRGERSWNKMDWIGGPECWRLGVGGSVSRASYCPSRIRAPDSTRGREGSDRSIGRVRLRGCREGGVKGRDELSKVMDEG